MLKFINLVITFIKIGAFSFGGGYAMIPLFEREIVSRGWSSLADYKKLIALAQMIPGPFAIDSSAYIGYNAGGIPGALLASIALVLPSFTASILITRFYVQFKSQNYIQMFLSGLRPVVLGLLASAAYIIGIQPIIGHWNGALPVIKSVLLITGGFFLVRYTRINTVLFILIFAVAGIILF